MEPRKANLEPPRSIDEARQRKIEVDVQIKTLNDAIGERFRYDDEGMPLSPEEHLAWRKRAIAARNWYLREEAILAAYISDYERDVRAEEEAEERKLKRSGASAN